MSTYKITNITNLLGKREHNHDSDLSIKYIDNFNNKTINVKAGETIYLTTDTLPMSVHKLRVNNLITVSEISNSELISLVNVTIKKETKLISSELDKEEPKIKKNQKLINKKLINIE